MKKYLQIILACCILVLAVVAAFVAYNNRGLRAERDRYKGNTEALLTEVQTYRVRDSLSAARVESLTLSLDEYKRFRSEDAKLIKQLTNRNRNLSSINQMQAQAIFELCAAPKDTVVLIDSVMVDAVAVHCGDAWYDFDGILTPDRFNGTLRNRDSLVVAESVRYKRFLGFLWKTKQVKDRRVDVLSKNPHTKIMGVEHIIINN